MQCKQRAYNHFKAKLRLLLHTFAVGNGCEAARLHCRSPLLEIAAAAPDSQLKKQLGRRHCWIRGQVIVLLLKVSIYSICRCLLIFL